MVGPKSSLHHAASRGKKDFLEKRQNGAIEGVQLSAVQKEQSFGHYTSTTSSKTVSNQSLLPLACSITFREKFSYSFVIEFIYATVFTILLGGPMGCFDVNLQIGKCGAKDEIESS